MSWIELNDFHVDIFATRIVSWRMVFVFAKYFPFFNDERDKCKDDYDDNHGEYCKVYG